MFKKGMDKRKCIIQHYFYKNYLTICYFNSIQKECVQLYSLIRINIKLIKEKER